MIWAAKEKQGGKKHPGLLTLWVQDGINRHLYQAQSKIIAVLRHCSESAVRRVREA